MPIDPITGVDLSALGEIDPYEHGTVNPPRIEPPAPPPPGSPPPPPAEPPRTTAAAAPPEVVWIYIRSGNSFPGNHPDYDDLKTHGVGGVLIDIDDPYRDFIAQTAREAGLRVGVWADPHGQEAITFAGRLQSAANAVNAELVAVDLEFAGKGFPGTPQWDYNAQVAAATRAALPVTALAVTPPPLTGVPTDYNFGAWNAIGAAVWMQIYGDRDQVVATPEQIRAVLLANGVPPALATVILPAGSLAGTVPQVQAGGFPYWALWTADDLTGDDRSIPFGEAPAGPADTAAPSSPADDPGVSPGTSPPPDLTDLPAEGVDAIDDASAESVDLPDVDATDWFVDESVTIDEPDSPADVARSFQSYAPLVSAHFPEYCLRSVSGYTQGVNGPISVGLRQLELIIGVDRVHDDYATHGHAHHSKHYCGLAADVDPGYDIWSILYPARADWLELFGPWGLYDHGVKFLDSNLQKAHMNHIHVSLNKTAAAVSILVPHRPDGRLHVPGGAAPVPTLPVVRITTLDDVSRSWHKLMTNMDTGKRSNAASARALADSALNRLK